MYHVVFQIKKNQDVKVLYHQQEDMVGQQEMSG